MSNAVKRHNKRVMMAWLTFAGVAILTVALFPQLLPGSDFDVMVDFVPEGQSRFSRYNREGDPLIGGRKEIELPLDAFVRPGTEDQGMFEPANLNARFTNELNQ